MKTLAVPRRSYSLSYFAMSPGRVGSGTRTSAINCLLHSSMQTMGRLGSCGRWYTSNTSSIAATNSADGPSGKHQPFFNQGLSSFFLAPDEPSHAKPSPHAPAPPADRRANAGSSANDRPARRCTPTRSSAPPLCHPSSARTPVGSAWDSTPLPDLLPRTACEPARRWHAHTPTTRQSRDPTWPSHLLPDPPATGSVLEQVSARPPCPRSPVSATRPVPTPSTSPGNACP